MSLAQVLPEVQSLSRQDKIRLIQIVAQELKRDAAGAVDPALSYPIPSPDREFEAAATLLRALEADRAQP